MISIHKNAAVGKAVDVVGWVLFIIWVLVAVFLRSFSPGVDSIGVGVVVLLVSLGRFVSGGTISLFWLTIGAVFVLAGLGRISGIDLPLFSIALIVCGILMLVHSRSRKR